MLVIASGHTWSTLDVWTGLCAGFERIGIEPVPYPLHERIQYADEWLRWVRKRHGGPNADKDPAPDEVFYQAGCRAVIKALEYNCEAAVVVCGAYWDARLIRLLQRAGIKVVWYGTESPYDDEYLAWATLADVVGINELSSVDRAMAIAVKRGAHTEISYMPVGWNPQVHVPGFGAEAPVPGHDVVFVGNVYPSRQAVLEAIDWTGIDLGLYGMMEMMKQPSWLSLTRGRWRLPARWREYLLPRLARAGWSGVTPLWQYVRGGIQPNHVTTALYTHAKIVLNLYRSETIRDQFTTYYPAPEARSVNPRVLEATASGAFLISEWRPEMDSVFGDAVPTFRDAAEAEQLIRHYLDRPDERGARAKAARERVLAAGLSYTDRARQIVAALGACGGAA